MAHSAGAPYALAFASRFPERVRGDICLLAPWVGGGENSEYPRCVVSVCIHIIHIRSWLQVVKVRAQWYTQNRPSSRVESPGVDDRQAPRRLRTKASASMSGPPLLLLL